MDSPFPLTAKPSPTASYDGSIGLFTLNSEQKPIFFPAHESRVASVSFSNSSTQLLSSGIDDFSNKLWNLSTQPPSQLKEVIPKVNDSLAWSNLSLDNQWLASVGREQVVEVYNRKTQESSRLLGHEQTIFKVIFAPDSHQLATVSTDATVKFWSIIKNKELFSLRLPTNSGYPTPLWDFDFPCHLTDCRLAIPLTNGNLMLYRLAYEGKPSPTTAEQKSGLLTLWQDYLDQVDTLFQQNAWPAAKQSHTEANSIGNPLIEQYPDDLLILKTAIRSYRQALVLLPENSNILDSLGWASFKMGKTNEAFEYLQKSYSKKEDLTLEAIVEGAAHLGEVLWITGDKKQAKIIWQQGLQDNPDSKILQETINRLDRK